MADPRISTTAHRPHPRVLAEGSSNQSSVQLPSQAGLKDMISQWNHKCFCVLSIERVYKYLTCFQSKAMNQKQFNGARRENDVSLRHLMYIYKCSYSK